MTLIDWGYTNELSQQENNQTTVVTPVNQRGRSLLLIQFATKRTSNINNPTFDEQIDYNKTMKIEKKTERYDNFLHIKSNNHLDTVTNSNMVINRQS